MTEAEFAEVVSQNDALLYPLERAAYVYSPPGYVGYGLTEAAAIALLFPIAKFILTEIGLPWLHEARRYSELWRLKVHEWINSQYEKKGFEVDRMTAVSDALREELEKISDARVRTAWENLADVMKAKGGPARAKRSAGPKPKT